MIYVGKEIFKNNIFTIFAYVFNVAWYIKYLLYVRHSLKPET